MLPIYAREAAIVEAVRAHRVVVVEGPAGTGKTTQLPRMLRGAGLAPRLIGITQPRRIAAVSVAWRIAEEEGATIGEAVGYAIRFDDMTSAATRIKVMTDGTLLQEARHDPLLEAYDIILVDEAHERSLNIDFTLGLLYRIVSRRQNLRVVISSATLHPGHFQRFFAPVAGRVPVVTVESRAYPLDVVYRPLTHGHSPAALVDDVVDAVLSLHHAGLHGHVLIFLPGEGPITRTAEQLACLRLRDVVILPLYGRLTRAEQERVFASFGAKKKIILATNVAETSITIEGVQAVVDCGLAKLPWYNPSTGITTLREGPVSQASAIQRAGRAGRTGPGTVVRLYDEASLKRRPRFSPEEILRINLSEAVLRLIDLGVHDVEAFDFPTPPPPAALQAALQQLLALGAIDAQRQLTAVGQQMVPFPLSPPLARMAVQAANVFPDAMRDVLVVGAFLSVRSPYTFPAGHEDAARQAHARLAQPLGDAPTAAHTFAAWSAARDRTVFCRRNFLEPDTMAFIDRAQAQLKRIAMSHGLAVPEGRAAPDAIVRCVACGFADRVLRRQGGAYVTCGDVGVAIHPSSSAYGSQARYVVAAELMNSGRTYAFNVSAMEPSWVVDAAPEAARLWNLLPRHGRRQGSHGEAAKASIPKHPTSMALAGMNVVLKGSGRRPVALLPLAAVAQISGARLDALPAGSHRWRAHVVGQYGVLARGALWEVVATLALVPWPEDGVTHITQAPLGALLEADRNLHAIGRHLPELLQPVLDPEARQAGWLGLVDNGGGGYWYEVLADYGDTVSASLQATQALCNVGAIVAPISAVLDAATQRLEGIEAQLAQGRLQVARAIRAARSLHPSAPKPKAPNIC